MPQDRFTAFDRLDDDWAWVRRSRDAARAIRRWTTDPALGGLRDLNDVLARRSVADQESADAVLRALARRADSEWIAARVLLQALIPGLHRQARTIGGGTDAAAGEMVGLAWHRIVTYPAARRPGNVAANLLLDVRKAYLRDHRSPTVTGLDDLDDRPLTRSNGVLVATNQSDSDDIDRVDDRDELRRLLDRADLSPETCAVLWGRATGEGHASLSRRLGVTEGQSWDRWRRGVARIAHVRAIA